MLKLEGSASELHLESERRQVRLRHPSALIDDHLMFRKVHIVDLNTGKATNLKNPGKMGQVAWSPDGKKLAMISAVDKHDPREGRLWIHEVAGKQWNDAFFNTKGSTNDHVESFAWNPGRGEFCFWVEGRINYGWRSDP